MTVAEAIELWPQLMSTNASLGSPAVAITDGSDTDWLGEFMSEAAARDYCVDFICLHYYTRLGTFNVQDNLQALETYLNLVWDKYGLPIWLTEFALINYDYNDYSMPYPDVRTQAQFAQASSIMLDALDFVERYAWYALTQDFPGATNYLFHADSSPTLVGYAYGSAYS